MLDEATITGDINELIPKISDKLKILDPKIFPNAKDEFCFFAAMTLVTNSGRDVPIAMANNEIKCLEMPKTVAIAIADFTTHWPPKGNNIQPAKK